MSLSSRRQFLGELALAGPLAFTPGPMTNLTSKEMFVHHVYFWLNNPGNKEDKARLVEGLKKLSKVNTIRMFHIGQPAGTNREVIDSSYDISWLVLFDDRPGQDSYQADPIHLDFIKECSSLWKRVVVYDSVNV